MRLTFALLLASASTLGAAANRSVASTFAPQPAFRTDAPAYTLHAGQDAYDVMIGVTFTNPTADTVYFPQCKLPPFELRKRVPGGWAGAWQPSAYFSCKGQPIVVAPRARWHTRVHIHALYPGSRWGRSSG